MEKDFEKEFMDYINAYGKKYVLFNSEYSCYSEFENRLIDEVSSYMDILIKRMSDAREISPEIHVYCLQEDVVNAFCFVKNHNYYIGINSASYVELIRKTDILSYYLTRNNNYYYYKNRDASEVRVVLWTKAIDMMLAHEYMHIILGHCDVICKNKAFLWEIDLEGVQTESENFDEKQRQALELFADEFAAKDAAWKIMSLKGGIEEIKYELLNYYLAVFLVFSIFYNYNNIDSTHPLLGVRFHSILSTVDDTIYNALNVTDKEAQIQNIDSVIDEFMSIIQKFPNLFAVDVMKGLGELDIDKHYIELYNIASDIVKITNKKAIYPIDEFQKMGDGILEKIDDERAILSFAAQMGMSYDDACELIHRMYETRGI